MGAGDDDLDTRRIRGVIAARYLPRVFPASQSLYADVLSEHDVMVSMRDGVKLATDIYRPGTGTVPASQRLPVLLHRTPYDKSEAASVSIAETLAKHGYVVRVQDIRGHDTIEWAASRPFSDGKVGMYGTSFHGLTDRGLSSERRFPYWIRYESHRRHPARTRTPASPSA